ncbi:MAG TPA: preprotein translocase subunit SecA [Vicinamibacterales bacterium]|nr:preprotein translocase subunit SecA [Vicinamibacterales bacterium]
MFEAFLEKIVAHNKRELKRLEPVVAQVNALEPSVRALTDEQLREKTLEFRQRVKPVTDRLQAEETAAHRTDDRIRDAQADLQQTLDDLLPEAFAVVREAGRRVLNMRHFDVQIRGGAILHNYGGAQSKFAGKIAEMKTGEGKTLVATLPAYLNAIAGRGVHIVTVNDYLARRDSEWMGKIYRFLGMSVGVIQHELNDAERQVAYNADITYGTNNEFGFDYLRDNMKFELAHYVQRGHHFAIVDEVDSILIDEARTPLIISGPAEESTELYYQVDRIIPQLKKGAVVVGDTKAEEREALEQTGDYIVDEKHKTVTLTESGMAKCERMVKGLTQYKDVPAGLYDPENMQVLHHINQALRAHVIFHRDVDYMVRDGEVVIVDEFTGRLMPGRRWSDGLHQAVEAKEKVKIERENQTLATVTFQNYFRKYTKLAGMTGTADTEAEEFGRIYKLDVVVVPPNRPLRRIEHPDLVYRTEQEKWDAIVTEIIDEHKKGRPVLVGTVSIEKSERLSSMLDRRGLKRGTTTGGGADKHVVLNAKYHAQEAEFVAQAGRQGAVTIATNMAGRGTDILLGGNPEFMARQQALAEEIAERLPKGEERFTEDEQFVYFYHLDGFYRVPKDGYTRIYEHFKAQCDAEHDEVIALGGLHILGTERHEARRIDNQLRGRAGRQGDPGSSRFYLSLEDDLMRIFGSDRISGLMQRLGMEEGVPIEHGMVTRAIERAQKQVETQNFSVRKHLLEYDDVMNKQRENVYALRRQILDGQIKLQDEEGEEALLNTREYLMDLAEDIVDNLVETYAPREADFEQWDLEALKREVSRVFAIDPASFDFDDRTSDEIREAVWAVATKSYEEKEALVGRDILQRVERDIMLQIVDQQWKDHLYSLDHLKEGIGLRGYGQRDPLVEYKKESYDLFQAMKVRIDEEIVRYLWWLRPVLNEEAPMPMPMPVRRAAPRRQPLIMNDPSAESAAASVFGAPRSAAATAAPPRPSGTGAAPVPARVGGDDVVKTVRHDQPKVGRNDPCPCGSGKKYKKCHGAAA